MVKKLLSLITAVYIAVFGIGMFVGCGNIDTPSKTYPPTVPPDIYPSETFYAYDAQTEEYEDEDYLTLTDTAAKWYFKDVAMNAIEFGGNVIFSGDKFTMTLEGSFSVLDTCTILYRGERENNGVLRIDSSVITTYSDFIDKPIVVPDNEVMYYCKKGSKPENPVLPGDPDEPEPPLTYTITISGNGGKFDGQNTITRTTDEDGHILINATPTRSGYVFKGYNTKADGSGEAVTSATVFAKDTTIYAVWVEEVTVTFMDGSTVFATKKLGKGDILGDYGIPSAQGKSFLGWYRYSTKYATTSVILEDTTLTAEWRTYEEMGEHFAEYIKDLSSASLPGHVYVHYWRYDHSAEEEGTLNYSFPLYDSPINSAVYGDWALWAWPNGGIGRTFNAAWIDAFGAVYDIDTTYTFTDCGWDGSTTPGGPLSEMAVFNTDTIGTQLFMLSSRQKQGYWANDGGNNYYNLHDYNHVFLIQSNFKSPPMYYNSVTGAMTGAWYIPDNPYV